MPQILSLHIYPIKSLGAIDLNSAPTTDRGFEYDRRWMLIDEAGRFLSQRELPQMARFSCQKGSKQFSVGFEGDSLELPFIPKTGKLLSAHVWSDLVSCIEPEKTWSDWFARRLGIKCTLVYMPDESNRQVDEQFATGQNSLSDGFPYLVTNQASLDTINTENALQIPMNRFRPNVVIQQLEAFQEDEISILKNPLYEIHFVKPCARCMVINTDQKTGLKHKEPLRSLAKSRKIAGKVLFGQNAMIKPGVKLSVSDNLQKL